MRLYVIVLILFLCREVFVAGFLPGRNSLLSRSSGSQQLERSNKLHRPQHRLQSTKAKEEPKDQQFKKYKCRGCSFVYDEEKGFKKRYPPGTKFEPLPTFMCPVCGAAKDQFHEYHED